MRTHWRCLVSATALAVMIATGGSACSRPKEAAFTDLPGLISAIQTFTEEFTKKGKPVPSTVSLSELVSRGYISTNSVRAFEGMEVTIWLLANPADPQAILMSARLPDGGMNVLLADGSVQAFSTQRFAEQLRRSGQQRGQ